MPETKKILLIVGLSIILAVIVFSVGGRLSAIFNTNLRPEVAGAQIINLPDLPRVSDRQILTANAVGDDELSLAALAGLVRDRNSGKILYQKNSDLQLPIASLTKLMTAIVVMKHSSPYEIVDVKPSDTKVSAYKADLVGGEKISVLNLLKAMLVSSANDAAEALARHAGQGSAAAFVQSMNDEAKVLGMDHTVFANPVGFDDEQQYSTAEDLSKLVEEFLNYPELVEIVKLKKTQITSEDGRHIHILTTTNRLVFQHPEILGLKTGYTSEARGNLIAFVQDFGAQYYSVILGSDDREKETEQILSWVKKNFVWE